MTDISPGGHPERPQLRLDDPDDPRFDDYRDLRGGFDGNGRRLREDHLDHVVIEGHLALSRAAGGPLCLRSVLVTPTRAESLSGELAHLPPGVEVLVADRAVLAQVTGFDVHRGVLASADRPPPSDPPDLLATHPRVAVLEGLTDLENVGAVFRVAAALGIGAVLLDDHCADPLYRRCVRVSLGWSTVIPHTRIGSLRQGLDAVHAAGHRSVALTPRAGSIAVDEAAAAGLLDDPLAMLVGAEGPGLTDAAIDAAHARVAIPMAAGVDSLNAATALAVVASFAAGRRGW